MSTQLEVKTCPCCGRETTSPLICQSCKAITYKNLLEHKREEQRARPVLLDGRILLMEEIGRGGIGTVLRGHDVELDRDVAVKFLLPELQHDSESVELFQQEGKALASVRHENVVNVYSSGSLGTAQYIVMELIEGRIAAEIFLAGDGELLPLHQLIEVIMAAAAGLKAMHARGVVHNDVKPSNIMLEEEANHVVIMDFGLGQQWTESEKRFGGGRGSPAYCAPEILDNRARDFLDACKADIYAFGVTMFELVTGRLPFAADTIEGMLSMHQFDPPPEASDFREDLPIELDSLIRRCLEKTPENRVESMAVVYRELERISAKLESAEEISPKHWADERKRAPRIAMRRQRANNPSSIVSAPLIIVAEPDGDTRNMLIPLIVELIPGCRIRATRSNAAAIELMAIDHPAAVFARLDDTVLNGVELAATMASDSHEFSEVHLVLTSPKLTAVDHRVLSSLGVNRLLLRPLDVHDVRFVLRPFIAKDLDRVG